MRKRTLNNQNSKMMTATSSDTYTTTIDSQAKDEVDGKMGLVVYSADQQNLGMVDLETALTQGLGRNDSAAASIGKFIKTQLAWIKAIIIIVALIGSLISLIFYVHAKITLPVDSPEIKAHEARLNRALNTLVGLLDIGKVVSVSHPPEGQSDQEKWERLDEMLKYLQSNQQMRERFLQNLTESIQTPETLADSEDSKH